MNNTIKNILISGLYCLYWYAKTTDFIKYKILRRKDE